MAASTRLVELTNSNACFIRHGLVTEVLESDKRLMQTSIAEADYYNLVDVWKQFLSYFMRIGLVKA